MPTLRQASEHFLNERMTLPTYPWQSPPRRVRRSKSVSPVASPILTVSSTATSATLPRPPRVKAVESIRKPAAPTTSALARKRSAPAVVTLEASKEQFEYPPLPYGKSRWVLRNLLGAGPPLKAKIVGSCPSA